MKEIRLYGHLGKRFGRVHKFDVRTTAEAIAALKSNFAGFAHAVLSFRGAGYKIVATKDKRGITAEELRLPCLEIIKIVPVVSGASAGVRIVAGAVMMVVAYYTNSPNLMSMGAMMILGGVSEMLIKPPNYENNADDVNNRASTLFNGPVNTSAQGNAIPLMYGKRLWVGSQVISAGLFSQDIIA